MNCIIVDDNKLSRTAIRLLISQIDFLYLKQECSNPVEAFNCLQAEEIDLVFLDVEMPGMTGIQLIKNLENRPIVILITSKKDYAIEAFELNVADYLVKPVNLSRFTLAVSRAKELFENRYPLIDGGEKNKEYIFVRSNSILTKIKLDNIIYIQAFGDYVNIFTPHKRYSVHCTLKNIQEKLSLNKFYQLHRSYVVALNYVDTVEDSTVYVGKHPLPIGGQFKKGLLKKLNLI